MKNFLVILLSLCFLIGCSPQIQKEINSSVDATTGLGAAKTKLEKADPSLAKAKCIALCQSELVKDTDLTPGPCLGNPLAGLNDWVCDVAHYPRQNIDDKIENQCSAFRNGKAKYFVEVDENCAFVRSE